MLHTEILILHLDSRSAYHHVPTYHEINICASTTKACQIKEHLGRQGLPE